MNNHLTCDAQYHITQHDTLRFRTKCMIHEYSAYFEKKKHE